MRARRQGGFTLIELLVTTGILALVMLLAVQLLAQVGRLLMSAQVELAEPSMDLTTRWLRRDVQYASRLGRLAFLTTEDPLELWGNVEGIVRYQRAGSNLDRLVLGMQGEEIGRRTMMRGVVEWHWRALSSTLVEVEVVYQHRVARHSPRRSGSPVEFKLMSEKRQFALRSQPRRFW